MFTYTKSVNVIHLPLVGKLLSCIANDALQLTLPLQSRLRPLNPLILVELLVGARSPATIDYPTKLSSHWYMQTRAFYKLDS